MEVGNMNINLIIARLTNIGLDFCAKNSNISKIALPRNCKKRFD